MDKRQVRTQARLFSTILELASERSTADVTMSEIAERAAVHRSTLYEHATSPRDLLQSALRSELDELRHDYLENVAQTDVATAVSAVTRAVLQHVDAHSSIYARGLGSGTESASLHSMLAQHFQLSTALLIEQGALAVPASSVSAEQTADSVAAYIANGTVGAIEVWLRSPQPRDVDAFLALFGTMLPAWWPLVGNARVS